MHGIVPSTASPWCRVVSQLNPVRHAVTISRAILVKGAGPAEIARPLTMLVVYAAVVLTFAIRQYSQRTA
jgi:ABC-2 type transport system permease protein